MQIALGYGGKEISRDGIVAPDRGERGSSRKRRGIDMLANQAQTARTQVTVKFMLDVMEVECELTEQ